MEKAELTDDGVWAEVDKVINELYLQYIELNELDLLSVPYELPNTQERDRNWDVPMAAEFRD